MNVKNKNLITAKLKEIFKNDTTPIETFIPKGEDDTPNEFLCKYLASRRVSNLGEYLTLISEKNNRNSLFMHLDRRNLKEVLFAFNRAILDYMYSPEKNIENNTTQESDFYKDLQKRPALEFIKGSPEMEKIAQNYAEYLTKRTEVLIDRNCSEEDIDNLIDTENQKYRSIVGEKRKEVESNKKSSLIGHARMKISESIKFHHDENSFDQNRSEKHYINFLDRQI